jgi:hypothetical protein
MIVRRLLIATVFTTFGAGCEGTPSSPSRLDPESASASASSSPRSGAFHVTKECSQYHGAAGEFCTITESNVAQLQAGSRVHYLAPLNPPNSSGLITLDSDIRIEAPGSVAYGRCVLTDFMRAIGTCVISGGTGRFRGFSATAVVSADTENPIVAHWDGTYGFARKGTTKN